MKIKTGISLAAIMIAALLAGCGSVSAPPVDLPAPITGRVDVSAPDAGGNVTITGTEGAVEGGELVMVINESEAGASLHLLDLIIPSAYAADFPAICSEVGYACEYAEEDGSFVIVIAAASDDTLSIGLIDPESGEWISERISVSVPQSGEPEPGAVCDGPSGNTVGVAIAPLNQLPVLLKQGSDTTTNQLIIGEGTDATTVDITGCYAHSIDITKTATGDLIAVTSKDDNKVWAGRLVGNEVKDARSFTVDYEPMDLIFVGTLSSPIVAMKTASSVLLQFISLADGTALETMEFYPNASTSPISGITRSIKLDVIAMDASGQYLGLALTDKGSPLQSYITIFRADTLEHYATWERTGITYAGSMVDAAFYVPNYEDVTVGILDSALTTKYMREYRIVVNTSDYLKHSYKLDTISSWNSLYHSWQYDCAVDTPKNLMISDIFANAPLAVMSDALGDVVKLVVEGMTADCVVEDWTAGDAIVAIDLDDALLKMFGADATTGAALDGSTLVY